MNAWKSMMLGLAISAPAMAQLTTTQCTNGATLTAEDFQVTELVNKTGANTALVQDMALSEPTRMDVQIVKEGDSLYSNVFFTERLGNVKLFDGKTKTLKIMGKIPTLGKSDNGLMGLALHPDYVKNRWIYFWYSPTQVLGGSNGNRQLRLVRITVKSDNTLDMTSEKILINIKGSKTDTWHSGGPMTFDAYGDLWVAVGNNSLDLDPGSCNVLSATDSTASSEWGPSNTASLRGGFFRIHPDSSEKGYSIPRGNFGEYWADYWEKQGDADLAKDYRDTNLVKPEVYVKGERSNYSIAVHPTKRWLAWGTVNYSGNNDEFNITPTPSFTGFPYFHANNVKTCASHNQTVAAPVNNSPLNSGVKKLPPAAPPLISNLMNVAIGGPIYVFNSSLDSKVKFPPHFHNKWLVGNEADARIFALTFDTATFKIVNQTQVNTGVLSKLKVRKQNQSMFGPDGALYVLNYDGDDYSTSPRNPGIMKVVYKGACVVPLTTGISAAPKSEAYQKIWLSQTTLTVGEKGVHAFALYDLSGQKVYQAQGREGAIYAFDRLPGTRLNPGVYLVRVTTAQGTFMRQASLL